ncbi:MAG: undecaprenyl-diphosphate phosphatase [bacterium]|nr:undecaprenyl-diphosphate phosphatase [bacterium]
MTIIIAIILGLVQGICEFLPISSSGHLLIFESLFNINQNNELFNVLLHLATLLSVILFYRKKIAEILFGKEKRVIWLLVLSMIPTCLVVVLIKALASEMFTASFLGFGFLFSATIIFVGDLVYKKKTVPPYSLSKIKKGSALTIGFLQGFACLPGISRSATTVNTALVLGIDKESAIDYSFILSIPVILTSLVYEIISLNFTLPQIDFWSSFVGAIVAFISSLLSIKLIRNVIKNKSWIGFGIYLTLLSIAIIIFTFIF